MQKVEDRAVLRGELPPISGEQGVVSALDAGAAGAWGAARACVCAHMRFSITCVVGRDLGHCCLDKSGRGCGYSFVDLSPFEGVLLGKGLVRLEVWTGG